MEFIKPSFSRRVWQESERLLSPNKVQEDLLHEIAPTYESCLF